MSCGHTLVAVSAANHGLGLADVIGLHVLARVAVGVRLQIAHTLDVMQLCARK